MRPPAISQLVNVTQSVMPTYMPTMTPQTTYQTMLTPASGTTVVSTAATYQQQHAAMLAALQLQQLSMYLLSCFCALFFSALLCINLSKMNGIFCYSHSSLLSAMSNAWYKHVQFGHNLLQGRLVGHCRGYELYRTDLC